MEYDVIIVGGGPAGSTAATVLAEHKCKILVVDKHTFPREKPCGGGLSTRVWKHFPYVEQYLDSICYGAITHSSTRKYSFTINREKPMLGMVRRSVFDKKLLEHAEQTGAEVRLDAEVIDVQRNNTGVTVQLNTNETFSAPLILGCDGMRSIVAEKIGLNKKHRSFGVCIYKEQKFPQKYIESLFTKDHLGHIYLKTQGVSGYGWVFPKKQYINIGLGEFVPNTQENKPASQLGQQFTEYIEMLQDIGLLPFSFTPDDAKGATLPLFPLQKTYTDHVMICGDAAGFINPISGEGIYYAMTSGKYAAKVAVEALKQNNMSEQFLAQYQHRWYQIFGKDIMQLQRFNRQWSKHTDTFMRLVVRDPTFAKLLIGVVGGQLSFSKYKPLLGLRYGYVRLKDAVLPRKEEENIVL